MCAQALQQDWLEAKKKVQDAEDNYAEKKDGPERIAALTSIRDAKRNLLDITRQHATTYGTWNANMREAIALQEALHQDNA